MYPSVSQPCPLTCPSSRPVPVPRVSQRLMYRQDTGSDLSSQRVANENTTSLLAAALVLESSKKLDKSYAKHVTEPSTFTELRCMKLKGSRWNVETNTGQFPYLKVCKIGASPIWFYLLHCMKQYSKDQPFYMTDVNNSSCLWSSSLPN